MTSTPERRPPPKGVYFSTVSWEFLYFPEDAARFTGKVARGKMIRVPAALAVCLGPWAGLFFVICVPLVFVVSVVLLLRQRFGNAPQPELKEQHR